MIRRPPRPPLFPSPPLFRSNGPAGAPTPRGPDQEEALLIETTIAEKLRVLEEKYRHELLDRKSTRLNSSHANISYAVFCLKKKTNVAQQRAHHHHTDHSDHQ